MKILTVSTLASGGAAIAARNLHTALCGEGHDALFLTLSPPADLPYSAPIGYGGTSSVSRWMTELFAYWASLSSPDKQKEQRCDLFSDATSALYDFVPQSLFADADIVHVHWGAGVIFSPFFLQCLEGKKVVFTLHDFNPFTGGCHYTTQCDGYIKECGDCPVLREPSPSDVSAAVFAQKKTLYASLRPAVVAPSQWMRSKAATSSLLSSRPMRHIPNAHAIDFYKPLDRSALRGKYDISPKDFVVLCGAEYMHNPRKGGEIFKELLELLVTQEDLNDLKTITFGFGKFDVAGNRHMGMVDTEELRNLYNIADVFIHPSLLDNLSNTLCEAQCCGTPVIAFNAGGNAEAFVVGKSGFLVAEQAPEPLLHAVQQLYSLDDAARNSMRHAARMYAEETFSPKRIAQGHVAFYTELLASPEHAQYDIELRNMVTMQSMSGVSNILGNLFAQREPIHDEIARLRRELDCLQTELLDAKNSLADTKESIAGVKESFADTRESLADVKKTLLINKIKRIFRQA